MSALTFALVVLLTVVILGLFIGSRSSLGAISAIDATQSIGVYWDKQCTKPVTSVDWGLLTPGQTGYLTLYVRNEGNQSIVLVERASNWKPSYGSRYLGFSWQASNLKIDAGKVVDTVQALHATLQAGMMSSFSFDIIFEGKEFFPEDVNRDGVVDGKDIAAIALCYGATPESANWNPNADLKGDGVINGMDVALVCKSFGKT
jgi:hypothetical protein